ncbi:hypothetical protein GQ53DRAFT_845311 [Thozetella sp. PMI_491]|nr:hypothetical protein GQ53DRAFT_845311 [Thozetella sp. PMI_491]
MAPSADSDATIAWLLTCDPAIKWQAMRDLVGAPEPEWAAERRKVETEGWGAALLAHQDEDGQWDGGSFFPRGFDFAEIKTVGQPWTTTSHCLTLLHEMGLDPASERAKRTVVLVGKNSRWDAGDQLFWEGETEECINGRTVADASYFGGVDVTPIVRRLLGERLEDGGWNCERANGSIRSSFATTINVLEGLLEFERATGGTPETIAARKAGEEYLLVRHLYRRLRTGEPADDDFLLFAHPNRWQYDVLRALNYFHAAAALTGGLPDPRLADAIDHVRSKRREDGKWNVDRIPRGRAWFEMSEGPGEPSPWVTLRALRVLKWWDSAAQP